jgi:hypothetical protein
MGVIYGDRLAKRGCDLIGSGPGSREAVAALRWNSNASHIGAFRIRRLTSSADLGVAGCRSLRVLLPGIRDERSSPRGTFSMFVRFNRDFMGLRYPRRLSGLFAHAAGGGAALTSAGSPAIASSERRCRTNAMLSPNGLLITFGIGVATTFAWQSYGDAARQIIANSYPQLAWLAPRPSAHSAPGTIGLAAQVAPSPDQQRLNAMSLDLDAVRQNVDRIAITQEQITRSVDRLTAGQQRMTRTVDQLTAGQERMTREISKLQAVAQQSKPPPRPASARKPMLPSSPAPTVR